MRAGLYSMAVVAEFLGQPPAQMADRVKLDGLPAIRVPCAQGEILRVSLLGLHRWLADRTEGEPLSVAMLEAEMERCEQAVKARHREKHQRSKERRQAA
jgi:hypothetical protein